MKTVLLPVHGPCQCDPPGSGEEFCVGTCSPFNPDKLPVVSIGIDPSLTSTGVAVLEGSELLFAVNIARRISSGHVVFKTVLTDDPFNQALKSVETYAAITGTASDQLYELVAYADIWRRLLDIILVSIPEGTAEVIVGMEQPFGSHQGKGSVVERAFTVAVMALQKRIFLPRIRLFTPSEIKKFLTGKGNAKKELMLKEVYKKFGYDTDINDMADAFAIAQLVRTTVTEDWDGRNWNDLGRSHGSAKAKRPRKRVAGKPSNGQGKPKRRRKSKDGGTRKAIDTALNTLLKDTDPAGRESRIR